MQPATGKRRRVLVTGASGGIGRAICHTLVHRALQDGSSIAIAAAGSRKSASLDALVGELRAAGAEAHPFGADISDPDDCARLVVNASDALGGLDGLVCNAGITAPAALAEGSLEDWARTFDINTRAVWLLARAARVHLAKAGGAIVAVSSMSGTFPHPGYGAYSAAKAALSMLCRQLAQEWAVHGIRVNTVSPGMIRTPLTESLYHDPEVERLRTERVPLARIGRPEDIAEAVAWLLGPASRYVTGQDLRVDGGLCDRLLGTIPGRAAS
ncbi:SDR family NAD(P)-dependent oxidoreductase [Paraburkholderia sp. IW21]|uniref:SDR family NAD(P)-dependent oxidoreductase n=1 Tax=Paraburkholderia sp. IW21 TaxID=3242488 RepID=UPI003521C238